MKEWTVTINGKRYVFFSKTAKSAQARAARLAGKVIKVRLVK